MTIQTTTITIKTTDNTLDGLYDNIQCCIEDIETQVLNKTNLDAVLIMGVCIQDDTFELDDNNSATCEILVEFVAE